MQLGPLPTPCETGNPALFLEDRSPQEEATRSKRFEEQEPGTHTDLENRIARQEQHTRTYTHTHSHTLPRARELKDKLKVRVISLLALTLF